MRRVLKMINKLDADQITEAVEAVRRRYSELFPDWEIMWFSMEKSKDPKVQVDNTIALLKSTLRDL